MPRQRTNQVRPVRNSRGPRTTVLHDSAMEQAAAQTLPGGECRTADSEVIGPLGLSRAVLDPMSGPHNPCSPAWVAAFTDEGNRSGIGLVVEVPSPTSLRSRSICLVLGKMLLRTGWIGLVRGRKTIAVRAACSAGARFAHPRATRLGVKFPASERRCRALERGTETMPDIDPPASSPLPGRRSQRTRTSCSYPGRWNWQRPQPIRRWWRC